MHLEFLVVIVWLYFTWYIFVFVCVCVCVYIQWFLHSNGSLEESFHFLLTLFLFVYMFFSFPWLKFLLIFDIFYWFCFCKGLHYLHTTKWSCIYYLFYDRFLLYYLFFAHLFHGVSENARYIIMKEMWYEFKQGVPSGTWKSQQLWVCLVFPVKTL